MATDMVNKPPHYRSHASGIECIEITRHLTFAAGNALKYVWRADLKNGREDLEKARFYLNDAEQHSDAVFLPTWNFAKQQLLDRVIAAEADAKRIEFFGAMKRGRIGEALAAVTAMLE